MYSTSVLVGVPYPRVRKYTLRQGKRSSTGLPPELWPRLEVEEVRGPSSEAMSAGVADTAAVSAGAADPAAVETSMAPPVPGVQKPLRWVGKRFQDHFAAVPLKA
jgi:hypothetical protein